MLSTRVQTKPMFLSFTVTIIYLLKQVSLVVLLLSLHCFIIICVIKIFVLTDFHTMGLAPTWFNTDTKFSQASLPDGKEEHYDTYQTSLFFM